jgi:O-antigen ligase
MARDGDPGIRTELGLLIALAVVLPVFEPAKNVLWGSYLLVWIANRVRTGEAGGAWSGCDTLLALLMGSGFVVALFAGLHHHEWLGPIDVVRYASLALLVGRGGYGRRALLALGATLVASTVAAALFGHWQYFVTGERDFVELRSVGHVNHSAIYVAIVLGTCVAATLSYWASLGAGLRSLAIAVVLFLVGTLIAMESRGAIGAAALLVLVLALAGRGVARRTFGAFVVALLLGALLAWAADLRLMRKADRNLVDASPYSYRDGLWRAGVVAWRRFPYFGVGLDNYSQITPALTEQWLRERGRAFDPARYYWSSHAHSLYVNTLAERGLFGFAAMAIFLGGWFIALVRWRPPPTADPLERTLWGAALSAWFVTVAGGVVNTTLHHEHGMLAMLFLGAWLAWKREEGISVGDPR